MSKLTQTPLNAVWLNVFLSILPGLLDLASPVAAGAIFSLTAVGMCGFDLMGFNKIPTVIR